MIYGGWEALARVIVVGVPAYLALLLLLRVSGKRTLSKLNAFDFIVTIAIGSTLATILLSSTVTLAQGVVALVLLVGLQYLVAWGSSRSRRIERLVKSEPTLVFHHGYLTGAMRRQRVTAEELRQAARAQGKASLDEVTAIVLETDGNLSILTAKPGHVESPDASSGLSAGAAS